MGENYSEQKKRMKKRILMVILFLPPMFLLAYYVYTLFWMCDDAYISFRYARNLKDGFGLVFNRGERVEGYTNFLWVLKIAAAWKFFGVHPEASSVIFSFVCTLMTIIFSLLFLRRGPASNQFIIGGFMLLLLFACSRPFALFTTSGLETRQVTFFLLLAIWFLHHYREKPHYLIGASLALAACEYTRPEGVLFWGLCTAWYIFDSLLFHRFRWKHLAWLCLPWILLVGAHFIFRRIYYSEWLPNTYYAKVVRPWYNAGFRYMLMFVLENGLYLLAPLYIIAICVRLAGYRKEGVNSGEKSRDTILILPGLIMTVHSIFIARIGGDHFEYRMFDYFWPFLFIGGVEAFLYIGKVAFRKLARFNLKPFQCRAAAVALCALLFVVSLFYICALQLGKYVVCHDKKGRAASFKLVPEITRDSFPVAFILPGMDYVAGCYRKSARFCIDHYIGTTRMEHKELWKILRRKWKPYEKLIGKGVMPESAVMALGSIGVQPFFTPEVTVIDTKGLTDKVIARNPFTGPDSGRLLAHDRVPPSGYLEKRGVNFILYPLRHHISMISPSAEYVLIVSEDLYVPFDSLDEKWVKQAFRGKSIFRLRRLNSDNLSKNMVVFRGYIYRGARMLGGFEKSEERQEWMMKEQVPEETPFRKKEGAEVTGVIGNRYVRSLRGKKKNRGDFLMQSPEFTPGADQLLIFKVAGSRDGDLGVRLLCGGETVRTWRGRNDDRFRYSFFDLKNYMGRKMRIEIFDNEPHRGRHIKADHFLLMDRKVKIEKSILKNILQGQT